MWRFVDETLACTGDIENCLGVVLILFCLGLSRDVLISDSSLRACFVANIGFWGAKPEDQNGLFVSIALVLLPQIVMLSIWTFSDFQTFA